MKITRLIVFLISVPTLACAHGVDPSFDAAEKALKGVDVAADEMADRWSEGVDEALKRCADTETKSAARVCLGKYARGQEYEADAEELARLYDELVDLLRQARVVAKRLEGLVKP